MTSLVRRVSIMSGFFALALLSSASAVADPFTVSYYGAGVQSSPASSYVENFNTAVASGSGLTTNFGGSPITGTYSGNFAIIPPDLFGGANGVGQYITTFSSYSLSLSGGVNYFGMWFSALDAGNQLSFYSGSNRVFSFSPGDYAALVGVCPTAAPAPNFCGNPNPAHAGNTGQQYAFLNFYDPAGTFDSIVFSENPAIGGFESDNHTLGNLTTDPGGTVIGGGPSPVPEPSSLVLLGTGCVGLAGALRRMRRR